MVLFNLSVAGYETFVVHVFSVFIGCEIHSVPTVHESFPTVCHREVEHYPQRGKVQPRHTEYLFHVAFVQIAGVFFVMLTVVFAVFHYR